MKSASVRGWFARGLTACSMAVLSQSVALAGTDGGLVPDAGPVCAADTTVQCPCEGGFSGTKQCEHDGSGFTACACGEPPLTPISPGGCKCRIGAPRASGGAGAGALAVLALALLRRRRTEGTVPA